MSPRTALIGRMSTDPQGTRADHEGTPRASQGRVAAVEPARVSNSSPSPSGSLASPGGPATPSVKCGRSVGSAAGHLHPSGARQAPRYTAAPRGSGRANTALPAGAVRRRPLFARLAPSARLHRSGPTTPRATQPAELADDIRRLGDPRLRPGRSGGRRNTAAGVAGYRGDARVHRQGANAERATFDFMRPYASARRRRAASVSVRSPHHSMRRAHSAHTGTGSPRYAVVCTP
jgi:hypothetical protein